MACIREIIKKKGGASAKQRSLALALFFIIVLLPSMALASSPPSISGSEWRTGGFSFSYSSTPGAIIKVYMSTDADNYTVYDSFTSSGSGTHVVDGLDNGVTYYYYVTQTVDGVESSPTEKYRQTPPFTVYVINWPDIFSDLTYLNDVTNNHLDQLFTPSQGAMDGLKQSVDNLSNAVGAGSASNAGQQLQSGLSDIGSTLKPPVVQDDGVNTYTGGTTGGDIPGLDQADISTGTLPDLDGGTDTELTFKIPITNDLAGNPIEVKLFTKEQLDKFMWIDLIRKAITAFIWIVFALYLVHRFAPHFKT